jgi:hypothetical protein
MRNSCLKSSKTLRKVSAKALEMLSLDEIDEEILIKVCYSRVLMSLLTISSARTSKALFAANCCRARTTK